MGCALNVYMQVLFLINYTLPGEFQPQQSGHRLCKTPGFDGPQVIKTKSLTVGANGLPYRGSRIKAL